MASVVDGATSDKVETEMTPKRWPLVKRPKATIEEAQSARGTPWGTRLTRSKGATKLSARLPFQKKQTSRLEGEGDGAEEEQHVCTFWARRLLVLTRGGGKGKRRGSISGHPRRQRRRRTGEGSSQRHQEEGDQLVS